MFVRPPQILAPKKQADPLSEALEQEILSEKIGTLSRLNKKLEAALAHLAAEEAKGPQACAHTHALLQAQAGEALWHVIIQREIAGLTGLKGFLDKMGVPREVRLNAGPVPPHLRNCR